MVLEEIRLPGLRLAAQWHLATPAGGPQTPISTWAAAATKQAARGVTSADDFTLHRFVQSAVKDQYTPPSWIETTET